MKFISKTFKLLTVFVLVLGLTGCSDDDDNNNVVQLENIVDIALGDSDLEDLVTALSRAGLVDAVRNSDDITVIAPSNQAFDAFFLELDPTGNTTVENVPVSALTPILLNHVITSRLPSATITGDGSGYRNTLATGPNGENLSIYYEFDGTNVAFNGGATVDNADIPATNGFVHKINAVVTPATIATFATTNPALSNLVAALQLADSGTPTVNWINTVSGTENANLAPFTVFAPTNGAFDALLLELDPEGNTALGDLDAATVDAVLGVHVVAGSNVQSSGLGDLQGTIPTLGGNLGLNVETLTITDGNGREIGIVGSLVNIQGTNGVVHVIDRVILPAAE